MNGVECSNAIPYDYTAVFHRSEVGDVVRFEMWDQDDSGHFVIRDGQIVRLTFKARVVVIERAETIPVLEHDTSRQAVRQFRHLRTWI